MIVLIGTNTHQRRVGECGTEDQQLQTPHGGILELWTDSSGDTLSQGHLHARPRRDLPTAKIIKLSNSSRNPTVPHHTPLFLMTVEVHGACRRAVDDEVVGWALDLLYGIDLLAGPNGGFPARR